MDQIKKSAVYTKTGDKGSTGLVGGRRISKADIRIESYGTIDELNSFIGVLLAEELHPETQEFLSKVQHYLFTIGSRLATDPQDVEMLQYSVLSPESVPYIEREIDRMDSTLPPLTGFILPSGGRSVSLCHVCRTVCRRAERRIYALSNESEVDPLITQFINRLSDFFFVLARSEAHRTQGKEVLWNKEACC